jgi:hypothetical protein
MAEVNKKARDGKLTAEEMASVTCKHLFLDSCEAVQSLVKPSRTCDSIKSPRKMHMRRKGRRGTQGCFWATSSWAPGHDSSPSERALSAFSTCARVPRTCFRRSLAFSRSPLLVHVAHLEMQPKVRHGQSSPGAEAASPAERLRSTGRLTTASGNTVRESANVFPWAADLANWLAYGTHDASARGRHTRASV